MWTLCCHRSLLNPLCPPFQPPSPLTPSSLSDCREGKYLRITLSLWLFFFPLCLETASPWGAQGEMRAVGHQVCYPEASDVGPSCLECYESRSQAGEQSLGLWRSLPPGWGGGGQGEGVGKARPCYACMEGEVRTLLSLVHPPLVSSQ